MRLQHVRALLWKNFMLGKSRPFSLLYLAIPLVVMYLASSTRSSSDPFSRQGIVSADDFVSTLNLVLVPNNAFTSSLRDRILSELPFKYDITQLDSVDEFHKLNNTEELVGALAFNNANELSYDIYQSNLYGRGILAPALAIVDSILMEQKGLPPTRFSYSVAGRDLYFMVSFALFIALSYVAVALNALRCLVDEKSNRIREGLKMMGVRESSWMASWAIYYAIPAFFQAPIILFAFSNLFPKAAAIPVLLLFIVFPLSLFALAYLLSAFFDTARVASMITSILLPLVMIALNAGTSQASTSMQILSSLFAPMSLIHSLQGLFRQRSLELLLQRFGTASQSQDLPDWFGRMDVYVGVGMLLLDSALYLLLGLYFHRVIPTQYGPRSPWNFPFLSWKKRGGVVREDSQRLLDLTQSFKDDDVENGKRFEKAPEVDGARDMNRGIHVRGLRKIFNEGQVVAVNGLNVDMYEGEVFALLGHNGAGKTTFIDCLTGLLRSSGGQALVGGYDINENMDSIRSRLGVCPQHNVLFDRLTVAQHLRFFAELKGSSATTGDASAANLLEALELEPKANTMAQNLSGGQKRKLSVAIAFIGGSQIVMLDEPSAGMDVEARQKLWSTIKHFRQDRVILLTTHILAEARLAQRIGIMAHGQMQCSGSPLFLSHSYGIGFSLSVASKPNSSPEQRQTLKMLVLDQIPGSSLVSEAGTETLFRLPFECRSQLSKLFLVMDKNQESCGIDDYAISSTTLEEIFLEVAKQADVSKNDVSEPVVENNAVEMESSTKSANWLIQFLCLIKIRWSHIKRDVSVWIYFLMLPLMCWLILNFSVAETTLVPSRFYSFNVERIVGDGRDPILFASNIPLTKPLHVVAPSLVLSHPQSVLTQESFVQYTALAMTREPSARIAFFLNSTDAAMNVNIVSLQESSNAVYTNVISNALLRYHSIPDSIKVRIQLFNSTDEYSALKQVLSFLLPLLILGFMGMYVPPIIAADDVRLRASNVQFQLLLSGVNLFVYWASSVLMGIVLMILPLSACFAVVALKYSSVPSAMLQKLALLLFAFCCASTPFAYVASLAFNSDSKATIFLRIVFMVTGPVLLLADIGVHAALGVPSAPTPVFSIFPANALYKGLVFLPFAELPRGSAIVDNLTNQSINFLFGDALGWFFVLFVVEFIRYSPRLRILLSGGRVQDVQRGSDHYLDEDVHDEEDRVFDHERSADDLVHVQGLRKVFTASCCGGKETIAVENISFGVPAGECFGFLGTNGAGKTTSMKMLIGEETPTGGTAHLAGVDMMEGPARQGLVGYCAQFDALIPGISGRQHLLIFGRLMGLSGDLLSQVVVKLIGQVDLVNYADRAAGTYSGGNKRKLSAALSLLGMRKIVFMDEPSAGIDPSSRRKLWDVIRGYAQVDVDDSGCSRCVVLTTQSLEECEAICSRISIMVDGSIRCIGSANHLKRKFGDKLQIDVNAKSIADVDKIKAFAMANLNGAFIVEQYDTHVTFSIAKKNTSLASVFLLFEENSEALNIAEYAIQQTSLEQVFLGMATHARQQPSGVGVVEMHSNPLIKSRAVPRHNDTDI